MKGRNTGFCLISLLVLLSYSLSGQEGPTPLRDSISTPLSDTLVKKNSFTSVFYGQPGKAALYSLILPGAGQIYNKRWWKVPLVWAGEGFLVYNVMQSINTFQEWDQCRASFLDDDLTGTICPVGSTVSTVDQAFTIRESARSQKEQAWIFLSIGHLINVFEAFVDRHLINFDTSETLTIHMSPSPEPALSQASSFIYSPPQIGIFSVSIPLNGSLGDSE